MTTAPPADVQRRQPPDQGTPTLAVVRRMAVLGAAAAVLSALFVLSFGYAQHSPRPHGVRIEVVAGPAVVDATRHALSQAVPGGFDTVAVSGEGVARRDVQHLGSSGALVIPPSGAARILTAGAAGAPLQQLVNAALTRVALTQGHAVQLVDVVPVHSGDRAGISAFSLELGLLVPSVIGAIALYVAGRRARVGARVAGGLVYCVLAGALSVLVLDVMLGAFTGSPWALFGDSVLIAATFVLSVAALHCLAGLPGTAVAAAALVVVGNAVNGVAVPTSMLPEVYRQLAVWTPNNAAVRLVRADMYFHGYGQSGALTTLGVWLGAAVLVLTATELVHRRALGRPQPRASTEVCAMSLIGHARERRSPGRTTTASALTSASGGSRPDTASADVHAVPS